MEHDCEMDCDFISRPSTTHWPSNLSVSHIEQNDSERPVTPPNNAATSPDSFLTPLSNIENDEPSFIKRVGFDRFNKHQRHTSTPTPLFMSRPKMHHSVPTATQTSQLSNDLRPCKSVENIRPINAGSEQIFIDYINPFTPDGKLIANKVKAQKRMKRLSINAVRRIDINDSADSDAVSLNDSSDFDVPSRPRLSEFNVSRFNEEFVHLKEIGKGVHGCVYKCLNRMNGCVYAIKRTIKPIRSSNQERIIRNEIYAHAVLDHPNVVRNFSCWKEDGYVFIQNEYCNGGSLEDYLKTNVMSEALLRSLLLQMANALRYIHKKELAHMDIKPGNILIAIDKMNKTDSIESDGGFSDEDKPDELIFKLGDLGHITKLDENNDVEEGDCRYLPKEILEENYTHLDRADIFALGLTVYEAAGGGPLPKNGDEWQDIRKGNLKKLDQLSDDFNNILAAMVQQSPDKRPSAVELITMVKPNPPSTPPEEMFGYLRQYRLNNTVLEHKVEATGQYLRVLYKSHKQLQEQLGKEKSCASSKDKLTVIGKKKGGVTKTRIVGKKTKRSSSTTTF